jgi:glucosamine-6-phosphate deaminase
MVEGPLSAMWPAPVLQFHQDAVIILDEEAASGLQRINYYKEVYAGKPQWQRYE